MSYLRRSVHCFIAICSVLEVTRVSRADNTIAAQPPLDALPATSPSSPAPAVPAAPAPTLVPATTPAETAPQTATDIPATPPPPAQSSVPDAQPINALGDAHWSDSLGFVQAGDGKTTIDKINDESSKHAPAVFDATLNLSLFRFGANQLTLNPINDGDSTSATGINVLEVPADFRFEWRRGGSLFVPWLDFGTAFWLGERQIQTADGTETNMTLGLSGFRFGLRFGMDVQPVEYVGLGPLIGARAELHRAGVEREDSSTPSEAEFEPDLGLQYGIHARFRSRARPGAPSRLYVDPALVWKGGTYQTGTYGSIEVGVRAGSIYFIGQYERRVGASGKFSYGPEGDATNLSQAYAASMPAEQRLGLAMAVVMAGVK